jgi:hypothetical protein
MFCSLVSLSTRDCWDCLLFWSIVMLRVVGGETKPGCISGSEIQDLLMSVVEAFTFCSITILMIEGKSMIYIDQERILESFVTTRC